MPDGYHEVRIVAVSDSPAAERTSRTIGFFVQRAGHTVTIEVENPKCSLRGMLKAKAVSSAGQKIQILQNKRTIATVTSDTSFLIPASRLGLGKTKLQAIAKLPNGQTIKSSPVSVLLESSNREESLKTLGNKEQNSRERHNEASGNAQQKGVEKRD